MTDVQDCFVMIRKHHHGWEAQSDQSDMQTSGAKAGAHHEEKRARDIFGGHYTTGSVRHDG